MDDSDKLQDCTCAYPCWFCPGSLLSTALNMIKSSKEMGFVLSCCPTIQQKQTPKSGNSVSVTCIADHTWLWKAVTVYYHQTHDKASWPFCEDRNTA